MIVAHEGIELPQLTLLVQFELPLALLHVAVNWIVPLFGIEGLAGVTVIEVTVAGCTVTEDVPDTPATVAVIVTVVLLATVNPVTNPDEFTVAAALLLEVHAEPPLVAALRDKALESHDAPLPPKFIVGV